MEETYTAGGVVMQKKTGHILVVEQLNHIWSLPKGHIDPGENELQAAVREIKEESGITQLEFIHKIGIYSRYKIAIDGSDDTSELKNMVFFLFETNQEKLVPEDPNNPSAKWVAPKEVSKLLTHKKDKAFFENFLNEST